MSTQPRPRALRWGVGGATALLALAAALTPTAQPAVASFRLAEPLADRCPAELGFRIHTARTFYRPMANHPELLADRAARDEFEAEAAARVPALGPLIRTFYGHGLGLQPDASSAPADPAAVNLVFRDGFTEHVELDAGPDGAGVWLPSGLADRYGISVGDTVTLQPPELPPRLILSIPDPEHPEGYIDYGGDNPLPPTTLLVSAIYRDLPDLAESRFWCGVPGLLPEPSLPMLLMDEALLEGDELGFALQNPSELDRWTNLTIERQLTELPRSIGEARQLADAVTELQTELATTLVHPDRPQTYFPPLDARPPAYESGLPAAVADAQARAAELRGVTVLVLAALAVLGAAAAGAAGVWWAKRRRWAVIERAGAELGPAALGGRAAWEAVVPAAVGAVAGWAGAAGLLWWAVSAFPGWPLVAGGLVGAAAALLVGVGVVAVAAGITSSSLALDEEFRTRRELR